MGYTNLTDNLNIADFSVASGYEKAKELLKKHPDLDALLCATDSMAAGAVQYLSESKISVPDQILVAGHGDSELSKVTSPPFVTVHYSYEKSGETAVQMLLEQLEDTSAAPKEVKLGYSIVDKQKGGF